jgi:cation diffusion facilitator family transporter
MEQTTTATPDGTRISVIAIIANILLMTSKITAGVLFRSVGLIADGVHSLADIFGAGLVLIGLRVSGRPADVGHPYGHSKAEPIAELVVAFIVILTGLFIIYDSITALLTKSVASEVQIGITVAGISTVTAWVLSHYKKRVGNRIKSSALIAESKHSVIDAISSLSVAAGLILTSLGFWYMDPIVGIVISILIIQIGISVTRASVDTLMDKEAPPELRERIREAIESVPEVKGVNYIHTRGSWNYKIVDASITVSRGLTVSDISTLQERIKAGIFSAIPEVHQVNVMVNEYTDIITVAASSNGMGLEATFANDLGNCSYLVIATAQKDTIDEVGSFANPYKAGTRKKGAKIADFMRDNKVDVVVTNHAGEGVTQWLRGYGISIKLVDGSGLTVLDAINSAKLFAQ